MDASATKEDAGHQRAKALRAQVRSIVRQLEVHAIWAQHFRGTELGVPQLAETHEKSWESLRVHVGFICVFSRTRTV